MSSEIDPRIKSILKKDGIVEFRDIQKEALQVGLLKGQNLLIAAPSAAGKTLIGELACISENLKGKKAAYLVPLRALATEKYTRFTENYSDLGINVKISTGDYDWESDELAQSDLFIMTYERFDSFLRISPKWIAEFCVLVIDEIHTIADTHRGPRLESLMIRVRDKLPDIQIVGLSATIKNSLELSNWMNATLIKSDVRPVELVFKIIQTDNKDITMNKIVKEIFESKFQVIIFVKSRKETSSVAKNIKEFIDEEDLQEYSIFSKIKHMLDPVTQGFTTNERFLFQLMTKGVAVHHAGLSADMRHVVEDLFRRNLIKVIVCTSTLAAGINVPARVVVIKDIVKYAYNRNYIPGNFESLTFKDEISPNNFHQMVGRAGRPGLDDKGTGVILTRSNAEDKFVKRRYFLGDGKPKLEDIISHFVKEESLLEQVLVVLHEQGPLEEKEILDFFKKTLWWHQEKSKGMKDDIEAFLEIGSLAAERVIEHSTLQEDKEEAEKMKNDKIRFNTSPNSSMIEGIFRVGTSTTASISPNKISCTCYHFKNILKRKTMCKHLYLLAKRSMEHDLVIIKDMICSALNKKFILDRLTSYKMVKFVKGKYACTKFGHLAVSLYLHPTLAIFIRAKLMSLKGTVSIFRLVRQIFEKESNIEISNKYESLLTAVNVMDDVPYNEVILGVSNELKIAVGDIENFLDHAQWILNAVLQIAIFEGNTEIANTVDNLLARFTKLHE